MVLSPNSLLLFEHSLFKVDFNDEGPSPPCALAIVNSLKEIDIRDERCDRAQPNVAVLCQFCGEGIDCIAAHEATVFEYPKVGKETLLLFPSCLPNIPDEIEFRFFNSTKKRLPRERTLRDIHSERTGREQVQVWYIQLLDLFFCA